MSLCNKAIKYKSTKIKEKIRGVFWDVIDQGWCQRETVGGGLTAWVISQTVPPPRPIVFLNDDGDDDDEDDDDDDDDDNDGFDTVALYLSLGDTRRPHSITSQNNT